VYFHNPAKTTAIGGTNHELYGFLYSESRLYAAQPQMVDVTSGIIRVPDMQDAVPTNFGSMTATYMPLLSSGITSINKRNVGIAHQHDVAFYDGRVEQDTHSMPALTVNNPWLDRLDVLSEEKVNTHMELFDYNAADWLVTAATARATNMYGTSSSRTWTDVSQLTVSRRALGTINGCSNSPVNANTGFGLNATSGKLVAGVVFPRATSAQSRTHFFDGPSVATLNDDHHVMLIQGVGKCAKGYASNHAWSVLNWLLRVELNAPHASVMGPYPLSEYSELVESPFYGSRSSVQETVVPELPLLAPLDSSLNTKLKAHHNLPNVAFSTNKWFVTDKSGTSKILPVWHKDLRGEVDEITGIIEYVVML
jgi:hypothetical protein